MLNRRAAVAVVSLLFAPALRGAVSTSTFTVSPYASFEYLGQQAKNETDFDNAENDERGNTVDRIRLGLNVGFSDQLRGGVEVVRAPFIAGTANQDAQFGNPPRSVNSELSNFYLENAFLEMDNILGFDSVRVGRQYIGRPGDFIAYYGPLEDNQLSVRSLQGVSVREQIGLVWGQFAFGTPVDDDAIPQAGAAGDAATNKDDFVDGGDVSLTYGFLNSDGLFKKGWGKFELEAGFYQAVDQNSGLSRDSNKLQIYDSRARFYVPVDGRDAVSLSLEWAVNGGADRGPLFDNLGTLISSGVARDYKGQAFVAKATYDWRGTIQTHALYACASGDDDLTDLKVSAYRDFASVGFPGSDFRHGEIFHGSANLGFTAGLDTHAVGDLGTRLLNVGLAFSPVLWGKQFAFKTDFFSAWTQHSINDVSKNLMNELDWTLRYDHSEPVSIEIGYARLHPLEQLRLIRGVAGNDDITQSHIKLNIRFGIPRQVEIY